jgi:hypothetical protein
VNTGITDEQSYAVEGRTNAAIDPLSALFPGHASAGQRGRETGALSGL